MDLPAGRRFARKRISSLFILLPYFILEMSSVYLGHELEGSPFLEHPADAGV